MKKILGLILLVIVIAVVSLAVVKGVRPLSWGIHDEVYAENDTNSDTSIAVNGFDVVAYHSSNRAEKGSDAYTLKWKEVSWRFTSEKNKRMFERDPEKYIPQHGGYCAYAHEKGFTAYTDPQAFEVVEDKLYLFADQGMKESWKKEYVK